MPSASKRKPARRPAKEAGKLRKLAAELRKFALSFPGAHEEYPWDERVVKAANNKVFVFLGDPYLVNGVLHCTVKLPRSRRDALKLPFAKPCGYGLGKHGWVTARIESNHRVSAVKIFKQWIDESYRAVAGWSPGTVLLRSYPN